MFVGSVTNKRRRVKQLGHTHLVGSIGTARISGFGNVLDEIPLFTWWNPFDKSASITLSHNDLRATANSNTDGSVRAVDGKSSGKWFFEITDVENVSMSSAAGVGLITGGRPLASAFTSGTQGVVLLGNGSVFLDGVFELTLAASIIGSTIGIAYDADDHLVWFRENGDFWNNDANANPETGIGGIDVSIIDANGLWPAAGTGDTGDSWHANFGSTDFAFEKPNGFIGWTTEGS